MLLKTRILLAEDDDTIVDLVYAALANAGFEVMHAENGARGLEMLRLYTPDLLVLDVMMPVMDGIEVANRLRKDEELADTPILMLTALSNIDNKVHGLDSGADAYIPKPFDLREFTAQLKALLRVKKRSPGRNPITALPGPAAIVEAVERALEKRENQALVYVVVRELEELRKRQGFGKAVTVVEGMAALLQDEMRKHFQFTAFLGHGGGGEFVMMVPKDSAAGLAHSVVERFAEAQGRWLTSDDGADLSLSAAVAVVPMAGVEPGEVAALSTRVVETITAATETEGSGYAQWSEE
ncbi:response regulator transcription factor [Haliangium sp.]|uniref:response regulator transcription factor n=1 Tax=Haliangium sp. TaxID=2663208 RepID=UPI003D0B1F75